MPELKPRGKIIARGTINFTLAVLQLDLTLNRPMPNTNYTVFYRVISGVGIQIPTTANKTTTGFRASVTAGVLATVEYIAIED